MQSTKHTNVYDSIKKYMYRIQIRRINIKAIKHIYIKAVLYVI